MRVLILNGTNLNLLGEREVDVYGSLTLEDIEIEIRSHAQDKGVDIEFFQSNHEGELIDKIQHVRHTVTGIVYNPGAHTHYSYALRDAVSSIAPVPVVEVHLSDIASREEFRRVSVIAPVCLAQISGKGMSSYIEGLDLIISHSNERNI